MKLPGLWRGYVVDNDDSEEDPGYLGRVKINVPEIYGTEAKEDDLPWAWPCMPLLGGGRDQETDATNVMFAVPPIGSTVWVMFEHGDIQVPVYMGTWYGKPQNMPQEAKAFSDGQRGAEYPEIFLLKMPWGETALLRFAAYQQFDIGFQDMWFRLKGETSSGAGDREIEITSATADITLRTTDGTITLSGKEVTVLSENDMRIEAGRYKQDGDDRVVDTVGSLNMHATDDVRFHVENKGVMSTSDEGGWFLHAANASGFEKHGGIL